jgi:CBS domain-containing protein
MALVGEVGAFPAFTTTLGASVVDAARVMRDKEVGDVVVVGDDKRVVGVLTDRDVTVRVVAAERDPKSTLVKEVCTTNPITVEALAPVQKAEQLMREHLVHRLPVVDKEGRPIGLISLEDLAASGYIDDQELRAVMRSIARAYQLRSAAIP